MPKKQNRLADWEVALVKGMLKLGKHPKARSSLFVSPTKRRTRSGSVSPARALTTQHSLRTHLVWPTMGFDGLRTGRRWSRLRSRRPLATARSGFADERLFDRAWRP